MQTDLATRQLSFREIFMAVEVVRLSVAIGMVVVFSQGRVEDQFRLAA